MNRAVTLPAICSLLAFGAFYAGRSGSDGYGDPAIAAPASSIDFGQTQASANDAQRLVRALGDQYQLRYRSWATASHNVMSRATIGPSTLPPIHLEIAISPKSLKQESNLASATISIRQKQATIVLPFVVDVATREIFVFQFGHWMTAQEWLDTAGINDHGLGWQLKKSR